MTGIRTGPPPPHCVYAGAGEDGDLGYGSEMPGRDGWGGGGLHKCESERWNDRRALRFKG